MCPVFTALTSGPVRCPQLWGEYVCSGYRAPTKCGPAPPVTPTPSPKRPPPPLSLVPAPPPPACASGSLTGADSRSCPDALTNAQIPATGASLLVAIVISGNDYPGLAFTSPITPSRHAALMLTVSVL